MRREMLSSVALAALCLGSTTALAQADRQKVGSAADREWISVTGSVESTAGDGFVLDYGSGRITVEMDDYDWYDNGALLPGDRVMVTGRMDDDLYDRRTIEASSVYVDSLNTYFYANPADEEGGYYAYPTARYSIDDEWVALTGRVVSRSGDTLTLDTGIQQLKVDMEDVENGPAVDAGDRITVYGELDDVDLFDRRELEAKSILLLSQG